MKDFLLLIFLFCSLSFFSQVEKVKFELEKTSLKININSGVYKSRIYSSNEAEKVNSFRQPAFFAQVYFPFKRSLDIPSNFELDKNEPNYYDRLFTACPIAVFHITDKGGNGVGLGQELSFKIAKKWFIKSQLAVIWIESSQQKNDGLRSGLNFHHYWYINYYMSKKSAFLFGYNHISNGKIFTSQTGALFDMIAIGFSHLFSSKIKN